MVEGGVNLRIASYGEGCVLRKRPVKTKNVQDKIFSIFDTIDWDIFE